MPLKVRLRYNCVVIIIDRLKNTLIFVLYIWLESIGKASLRNSRLGCIKSNGVYIGENGHPIVDDVERYNNSIWREIAEKK